MLKRLFDIIFSALGLTICLPLFAVVAVLIKAGSKGPVFFAQERVGRDFKPFRLYKFRTMVVDAPSKGLLITTGGDSRVTPLGRFLRKTKVDELPQLVNVLKGNMSIVGPRPEVEKYVDRYKKDYAEILKVRPGITDSASLKFRNEEAVLKEQEDPEEYYVNVLLPEKIELAKQYVKTTSFTNDLKLIILTLYKVVHP